MAVDPQVTEGEAGEEPAEEEKEQEEPGFDPEEVQGSEPEEDPETTKDSSTNTYNYIGDGVTVTAITAPGSGIPEDAELHADKLQKGSDAYDAAYQKVWESLGLVEGDELEFVPYDIYFTLNSGDRIEPESGMTTVTMTFAADPFAAQSEAQAPQNLLSGFEGPSFEGQMTPDAGEAEEDETETEEEHAEEFIVHIREDGTVEQPETTDLSLGGNSMTFQVGSFSVMGPVKVVKAGVETIAGSTYYVELSEDKTKLTFTSSVPTDGEQGKNWWPVSTSSMNEHRYLNSYSTNKENIKSVEFKEAIENLNGGRLLSGFTSLETVTFTAKVSFNNIIALFEDCRSLKEIVGLNNLDVASVITMMDTFKGCESLESLDLSSWDTSNVKSLNEMFEGCSSLTTLNLDGWNTTLATSEVNLFDGCLSLRVLTVGPNFKLNQGHDTNDHQIHDQTISKGSYWIKDEDTDNRMNDKNFIGSFEKGGAAGTYYWVHEIWYDVNGDGHGVAPIDKHLYKYGEFATLLDKGDITGNGQEVFIGWSEEPKRQVKSKDDLQGVMEPGDYVQFADRKIDVYAVFATDLNNNDIPDYEEYVNVTFDINGGTGSSEDPGTFTLEDLLPGSPLALRVYYTLKWTKSWNKDGKPAAHPAILAGWTEDESLAQDIILENDLDSDGAQLSRKLIDRYGAKVPSTDTTYYAVYAEDENGDQLLDYLENSLHVEYYANGGQQINGNGWIDGIEELFYRCTHHHVPNEDGVTLLSLDLGKQWVKREGAALLGWSEEPVTDLVTSVAEETTAKIVTSVTMPEKGNKKVYAVWAVDSNKNGTADYAEEKVTITFDINGGNGSGDTEHKTTFTVDVLPGTSFDLPDYKLLHWSEEWVKDGQPANYPAILAGWSETPVDKVIPEDDIDDEDEDPNTTAESLHLSHMIRQPHVTVTGNVTYYAMYAADENGDKEPDYLEYAEQVEYYANGGKMMVSGSWLDGIAELFYRCGHHHVAGEEVTLLRVERGKELIKRDSAVLLGWSAKQVALVTTKEQEETASLTETYIMPGIIIDGGSVGGWTFVPGDPQSDSNGKVYAVWAIDANGNQIPDYNEDAPTEPTPTPPTPTPPTPTPDNDKWFTMPPAWWFDPSNTNGWWGLFSGNSPFAGLGAVFGMDPAAGAQSGSGAANGSTGAANGSAGASAGSAGSSIPATADESQPWIWVTLLAVSLLGLMGTGYMAYRRKKRSS